MSKKLDFEKLICYICPKLNKKALWRQLSFRITGCFFLSNFFLLLASWNFYSVHYPFITVFKLSFRFLHLMVWGGIVVFMVDEYQQRRYKNNTKKYIKSSYRKLSWAENISGWIFHQTNVCYD